MAGELGQLRVRGRFVPTKHKNLILGNCLFDLRDRAGTRHGCEPQSPYHGSERRGERLDHEWRCVVPIISS